MKIATDIANCIVHQNYIGRTVYVNICDGTQRAVEWGAGDWVSCIAASICIALLMSVLIGMLSGIAYMVSKELRD